MTDKTWEREDASGIEILRSYAAEICGEKDALHYHVEWIDEEGRVVEAETLKSNFENFPHEVVDHMYFSVVLFKDQGVTKAQSWPICRYWSKAMLEKFNLARGRDPKRGSREVGT